MSGGLVIETRVVVTFWLGVWHEQGAAGGEHGKRNIQRGLSDYGFMYEPIHDL